MRTQHLLYTALLGAALTLSASCTLLLDTTECSSDTDCEIFAQGRETWSCVAQQCKLTDDGIEGISGSITQDTTWTEGSVIRLSGLVFVESGVRLIIEQGVRIEGESRSGLIVRRGATVEAVGTELRPIVFTSSKPRGERQPGDWGGVVLMGEAPINVDGGEVNFEALEDEPGNRFGGSNPRSNCGVLQYVRIEYAGFPVARDKELNGLTLAGCGSDTLIDYVQVHRAQDDGVEILGGTVSATHVLITRALDDSLDWDMGWTGTVQYLAIQQDGDGQYALEASNDAITEDNSNTPRSAPTLANVTIVGSPEGKEQTALYFKEGTGGEVLNAIVQGSPEYGLDIVDASTAQQAQSDALRVRSTLFFECGEDGATPIPTNAIETGAADNDGGFDEDAHFRQNPLQNIFDQDPLLPAPYDLLSPNFVPPEESPATTGGITPPPGLGLDDSSTFLGAFAPGREPWTGTWVTFDET